MSNEPLEVVRRVVRVFESLGIASHLGGSYASSIHGEPRQTHDVDLVADLEPRHVSSLVSHLEADFYIDDEMMRSALKRGRSFNLIHFVSGLKIDIFPLGTTAFDRVEFQRSRPYAVLDDSDSEMLVKSPEDTVLRKLHWYRAGGEVSDRQWRDVLGIVKAQGDQLDRSHIRRWAIELQVEDLVELILASESQARE